MTHAPALTPSLLQEGDRTLRPIRDQALQAVDELQRAQNAKEHGEVSAVSGLDAFYSALGNPRFLGQLRLREIGIDAAAMQARAELL